MSSDNRNYEPDRLLWRHSYNTYNFNSKILLITIIIFSLVILIVFAYHLYAKFVLRHRRPSFEDLSIASQPSKRGLDTLAMASLPTFLIGVITNDFAPTECPVCLSLFEENDIARMLPNCKHVFHMTCVDTWLTTCSTCPVCRNEVEPSQTLEPEPREGPVGDFAIASSSVRERSLNMNDHPRVDQDRVSALARQ